jgi:spore maturation protein CgeB
MSSINKIAAQMRDDWNRRVRHDYRFWMSDGHKDDQSMWAAGARDFEILTQDLGGSPTKTFLELGCGVGRLLRSALDTFGRVIGVDVSDSAISKAAELLRSHPRAATDLQLVAGNGHDLHEIPTGSVDVAASFAALTSIPTPIIASYLRELHRVVKLNGILRLQVYLGQEQVVSSQDTLHLRCFRRAQFESAVKAAGFDVEWIRELVLPFQVSAAELGFEALIISLRRADRAPEESAAIAELLLPEGEAQDGTGGVNDLECWMALNYAKDLVAGGDPDRAREALEYATAFASTVTIDISDMLNQIVSGIEKLEGKSGVGATEVTVDSFWDSNGAILSARFPELWSRVQGYRSADQSRLEWKETPQGAVLWVAGSCLDHPEKPTGSADVWAKRVLQEQRSKDATNFIVYGLGAGYHLEALAALTDKNVSLVEPDPAVVVATLEKRDLRKLLTRLHTVQIGTLSSDTVDEGSELIVRPQTAALHPDGANAARSATVGKRGLTALHPSIAVLGPLMGGTLPIANYCSRAFALLGQRLRYFDVSCFAPPVNEFEKFVKDKTRQQVLWANYSEMVSQVVIEAVTEKPIDILVCMAQAPISQRALTELRKRGVITVLWFQEDYLRFTYWREFSKFYDFVFTIQEGECLNAIRQAGAGEVHYLPMACDPGIHRPVELTAEERETWGSPVSFVGAGYHNRQQMFAALAELPFKIWGTEWPECRPFDQLVQQSGRRISPEEYNKIFNGTEVNLNLHSSTERDGVDPYGDFINPRTFELASCGAFQLVDERQLLNGLFEPGKELVTFKDLTDLKEKIEYYRAHPEERQRIAEAGRQRVLREHTYQHRVRQMLNVIYSSKFDHLKSREKASPWVKMLERSKVEPELQKRCEAAFERGEEPILDGLVSDIVCGQGKLSDTEKKLLFLFHLRKQIKRMQSEEAGDKR